jgi:hypothetical protein
MPPATFPLAAGDPLFVKEEPLNGPRNNAMDDIFAWSPIILDGIVDAQARKRRFMTQPVDVLRRLARAARIGSNRWIDDEYADVGIVEIIAVEEAAREIHQAHPVRLADRRKCAFPDAHPSIMRNEPELRAFSAQFPVLFVN